MTDIRNEIRAILRVSRDGESFDFPIQGFQLSWSVNQIPQANCSINTGDSLRTDKPSRAHQADAVALLNELSEARILVNCIGPFDAETDETWDDVGEVELFFGRIAGISPLFGVGVFTADVTLVHWLADLAYSSAMSEQSGHGEHASLKMRAIFQGLGGQAGTAMPSFLADHNLNTIITRNNIQQDVWGKALHPAFCQLATRDPLIIESAQARCVIAPSAEGNDILKAGLARFEGAEPDCGLGASDNYAPLALDAANTGVADSIFEYTSRVMNTSLFGRSIWDKLIELAGGLEFAIVPMIDRAMVVPLTLGLRSTYVKRIKLRHQKQLQPERWNIRPIRSSIVITGRVGSYTGMATQPDAAKPPKELTRSQLIGGCFVPEEGPSRGLVLVNNAPTWLSQIPSLTNSPRKTLGAGGPQGEGEVGNATGKTGKDDKLRGDREGKTPAEALAESLDLYNKYAQYLYVLESLKSKTMQVTVPTLRPDIAPGSSIQVEAPFSEPLFGGTFFGTVSRVTIICRVDQSKLTLATQFRISGIRSASENEKDGTSIAAHPLYAGKQFVGAPLHPRLKFEK